MNRWVDRSGHLSVPVFFFCCYSGNRSRICPTLSTPEPKMDEVRIQLRPISRRERVSSLILFFARTSTPRALCLPAVKAWWMQTAQTARRAGRRPASRGAHPVNGQGPLPAGERRGLDHARELLWWGDGEPPTSQDRSYRSERQRADNNTCI